ncbi:hypothetical protein PHYBOEH_010724 [Phytophthora boehmeriae]|uniref:Uncharacterized protein n=1 Tax=Phytophthora boehmeriae TaxID=109152 RepID=A0A8T1WYL0_9STRA|nr:hypothetical protein PHYBOEH_010724 [Phytophthora boehmeriae]
MKPSTFALFSVLLLARAPTAQGLNPQISVSGTFIDLDPKVQHVPLDPSQESLRPPPPRIPETFDIFIGSSSYRDGYRCGKTVMSAISRATYPDRLRIGLVELVNDGDVKCLDEYCKLAEAAWPDKGTCPYQDQIQVDTQSADVARGYMTARHRQQKLIQNEEFCLQIDAHSQFARGWDEMLVLDWSHADNEMAVITTYPHQTYHDDGELPRYGIYPHICKTYRYGNGYVMFPVCGMIANSKIPQLEAFWSDSFSFGKCHAERNVPVDPHMPWLWNSEAFLRSAILWTHGYEMYSPSENGSVISHNYTDNENEQTWGTAFDEETKTRETELSNNRYRLQVGAPFKGPVDTVELDKYSFGSARTYLQYLEFTGMTHEEGVEDIAACRQLHWVPYTNASAVESIVDGWKLRPDVKGAKSRKQLEAKMGTQLSLEEELSKIDDFFTAAMWFAGGIAASMFISNGGLSSVFRCCRRRSAPRKSAENRQRKYVSDLQEGIEELRADIYKLEVQKQAIVRCTPTNENVWNVVAEYFRHFRHGYLTPLMSTEPSVDQFTETLKPPQSHAQLEFLQATMASDVTDGALVGPEALLENWRLLSLYHTDVCVELKSVEIGSQDSLIATISIGVTITENTLRYVYPHLISGEADGGERREWLAIVAKLLNQRLMMRGRVHFYWDDDTGRVKRLASTADMVTPMLRLLGSLEEVAHVFNGALISPDCKFMK